MRVTTSKKKETRERIIACARELFIERGVLQTTTRDIAAKAGIASGTLFNYFPSKEDLALSLIQESLDGGLEEFRRDVASLDSAEEALFSLIMSAFRSLAPYQAFVGEVAETMLGPFNVAGGAGEIASSIRDAHLEELTGLLGKYGFKYEPAHVILQLYWTLYLGLITSWSRESGREESETLAVLDRTTRMFLSMLEPSTISREVDHGS